MVEWQTSPDQKQKQPRFFKAQDGQPLGLAGLWERWEHGAQVLEACSIIVCRANALARPIHDRMPVILAPEIWAMWLSPEAPASELKGLLLPSLLIPE